MTVTTRWKDLGLGIFGIAAAGVILFVWIPADISTGVIDTWRRVTRIGDAMLPVFASIGILLSCMGIAANAALRRPGADWAPLHAPMLLMAGAVLMVSLALMMLTGPVLAWVVMGPDQPYRVLRDDMPWKYSGFLTGGTFLIAALQALVMRRLRWRSVGVGLLASVLIAMFYGLPFEDLLLPPNGDF